MLLAPATSFMARAAAEPVERRGQGLLDPLGWELKVTTRSGSGWVPEVPWSPTVCKRRRGRVVGGWIRSVLGGWSWSVRVQGFAIDRVKSGVGRGRDRLGSLPGVPSGRHYRLPSAPVPPAGRVSRRRSAVGAASEWLGILLNVSSGLDNRNSFRDATSGCRSPAGCSRRRSVSIVADILAQSPQSVA